MRGARAALGGGGPAQRDDQDPRHAWRASPPSPAAWPTGINVNVTLLFSVERLRGGDRGLPARAGAARRGRAAARPRGLGGELLREPGGRQGRPAARARRDAADARGGTDRHRQRRLAYDALRASRSAGRAGQALAGARRAGRSARSGPRPAPRTRPARRVLRRGADRARAPSTPCRPRPSRPTATTAQPAVRIADGHRRRRRHRLAALAAAGIDLDAVTRDLEADGVAKFAASFRSLLGGHRGQGRRAGRLDPSTETHLDVGLPSRTTAHPVDHHRDDPGRRGRVPRQRGLDRAGRRARRSSRCRRSSCG